jgi:hypothetical protein
MLGLETALNVNAIVSVLYIIGKAVQNLSRCFDEIIHTNLQASKSQLLKALQESPKQINTKYDGKLRVIGPSFATGDSMLCNYEL